MGNRLPWWEIIFHGGISCVSSPQTPIHRDIHRGGAAFALLCRGGRRPPPVWMGVSKLGGQEITKWKIIASRGKWFPNVENSFPPYEKQIVYRFPSSIGPCIVDPVKILLTARETTETSHKHAVCTCSKKRDTPGQAKLSEASACPSIVNSGGAKQMGPV